MADTAGKAAARAIEIQQILRKHKTLTAQQIGGHLSTSVSATSVNLALKGLQTARLVEQIKSPGQAPLYTLTEPTPGVTIAKRWPTPTVQVTEDRGVVIKRYSAPAGRFESTLAPGTGAISADWMQRRKAAEAG